MYARLLVSLLVLAMLNDNAQTLTRGPYLQQGNSTGVIVRFATNTAFTAKIKYGTSISALNDSVSESTNLTEHTIKIAGAAASTRYYYAIYNGNIKIQGDANNYFITAPTVGSTKETRVWITGDCGNNSSNQLNVRDKMLSYLRGRHLDLWLLAGDNAYNSGTVSEYDAKFFPNYQDSIMKRFFLYPAPGNHDYANSAARQADHLVPYYDFFNLPTAAECGGQASGTEAYYSYNYANIHFVSMDSYGLENSGSTRLYDTTGAQAVWLKKDLDSNKLPWVVVYFHHPPYTKGSHNSDSETELINMRQRLCRILDRYKVDLVVCGHSHSYERSYLINGHYGVESTFSKASHAVDSSSAQYNGSTNTCPYIKNTSGPNKGAVYIVTGSSGQLGGTTTGYPHNAMFYSDASNGGSLLLTINNNRMDGRFICADGVIRDSFTMMKNVKLKSNYALNYGDTLRAKASWIGNYSWNTGETVSSKKITMPFVWSDSTLIYRVTDGKNCLVDSHIFYVYTPLPAELTTCTQTVIKNDVVFNFTVNTSEILALELIRKDLKNNSEILVYKKSLSTFVSGIEFIDQNVKPGEYEYSLTVVSIQNRKKTLKTFHVLITETATEIKIYPNPAAKFIQIDNPNKNQILQLVIFNSKGQRIIENKTISSHNNVVCIQNLSSGMYFIKLLDKNQRVISASRLLVGQ